MGSRSDPTRPTPARYLVRFGYDGSGFFGLARQPGLRTVEGEIGAGLLRLGIAPDLASASLSISSRTDRGVHARANALAIQATLRPDDLLRALNGIAPDLWFTHAARIPAGFRPRTASQRWYRYFERPADSVPPIWREAARALSGRIDIRSFALGIPRSAPTYRDIESIEPRVESGWLVLDVRARAFAWGMVRKLVSALRRVEAGEIGIPALSDAVRGHGRVALPLAEPDRLVLWETTYPVAWEVEVGPLAHRQERRFRGETLAASARARILADLSGSRRVASPPA